MRPERVEVHIDELVLHGFPAVDRRQVADTIGAHLTRLLAAGESSWSAGDVPALDAGSFSVPAEASPEAIGAAVAQALYGGLAR